MEQIRLLFSVTPCLLLGFYLNIYSGSLLPYFSQLLTTCNHFVTKIWISHYHNTLSHLFERIQLSLPLQSPGVNEPLPTRNTSVEAFAALRRRFLSSVSRWNVMSLGRMLFYYDVPFRFLTVKKPLKHATSQMGHPNSDKGHPTAWDT